MPFANGTFTFEKGKTWFTIYVSSGVIKVTPNIPNTIIVGDLLDTNNWYTGEKRSNNVSTN